MDSTGDYPVKLHSFDHVFGDESTNEKIFDMTTSKLADAALDGFNSVLFMYGQTSSGKTFTLFGGGDHPGLVHLTLDYVYKKVMSHQTMEYVIRVQYAELYNEELKDLLSEKVEKLDIIDHPQLGPIIKNISEVEFTSAEDIKKTLLEGESRRHFGMTNMNAHSSRSHVIVRLTIEGRKVSTPSANPMRASWGKDKCTISSTLNLVDLAGSERVEKSGTSGVALREGAAINKSLLTLGNVINALTEGKGSKHINYRDSKLTRLLAAALGGNARTLMITCVSPASGNLAETQSTLKFASRAKKIVNVVSRNEAGGMKNLAAQQKEEIEKLKAEMRNNASKMNAEAEALLREKALEAKANVRRMKFIMLNANAVIKALGKEGQASDAKKIQSDIHLALSGQKDLSEVMECIQSLSNEYLSGNERIMKQLSNLEKENETEDLDDDTNQDVEDTEVEGGEGGLSGDFDETEDVSENWGNLSELQEQLEVAYMQQEDLRAIALMRINLLMGEDKKQKKTIEELHISVKEAHDTIAKHSANEQKLQRELDELKKKSASDREKHDQETELAAATISDLELTVDARDTCIREKDSAMFTKDAEIQRNKSEIDRLNQELLAGNALREQSEIDFKRARHEMKSQMDKLRANMHNLMKDSGDTSQALTEQVSQLQQDLDNQNDALQIMKQSKDAVDVEISHVRSDLQKFKDESKSHIDEIAVLKSQIVDMTQQAQAHRLEITNANAKYLTTEKEINLLREQNMETFKKVEAEKEEKQEEFKEQFNALYAQMHTLQSEIEILKVDKQSLLDDVERKQETYNRLKDQMQQDTNRLEKKILAQIKINEEVSQEGRVEVSALQSTVSKLREELQKQKELVQERDQLIENIDKFLSINNFSGSVTEEEQALAIEEVEASTERVIGTAGGGVDTSFGIGAGIMSMGATGMVPKSASLLKKAEESALKYENAPGVAIDSSSTPFVSTAPLAFSPQFLGVKEGIELITRSLQYVCREESIIREFLMTEQNALVKHLDNTLVGLMRYRTEVAHLNTSKTYLTDQIDNLQRKVDIKTCQEEKATLASRELESKLAEMSGEHALAKESIRHFDMDKMSLKILLDKSKQDAAVLTEKLEERQRENESLCEQSEKFVSNMLDAQTEARELVQKLCIVEAERDELKKQFITNAHLPVTSQFTDTRYNLPPNSNRIFVPSRSISSTSGGGGRNGNGSGSVMIDTSTPRDRESPVMYQNSPDYTPRAARSPNASILQSPMASSSAENDVTAIPPGISAFVNSFSGSAHGRGSLQSPMYKTSVDGIGSNSYSNLSLENMTVNTPGHGTPGPAAKVFTSSNRITNNSGTISGVHTSSYKTPLSAKYM